ncbi:MAG: Hsp20/alpha crystallin family protein [Thermoplasmata archaeon]|nr:MAG: Hsp20/alpha crystallin family protein [Thermoplasmata archaeon]
MIFDDEKRRKKEAEDFEKIVREMEKIIAEAFKSAFNMQPFVKGFSLKINEDGEPEFEELNFEEEKADIFEDEKKIYVTLELSNVDEKDIKIKIKNDLLQIFARDELKEIKLPAKVKRKLKKSYRNGILDIELEKL